MKKRARWLAVLVLTVLLAAAGAGCAQKQTATLTLLPGEGGTLDRTEYEVEVGTDLASYLEEIVPAAEDGLTFAGWYGEEDVDVMPQEGLTLQAKYYAHYTAELHFPAYAEEEDRVEEGQAFYGEPFTYVPQAEHYIVDESAQNVLTVSQLGKEETFVVHLIGEPAVLSYEASLPSEAGFSGMVPSVTVPYGETVAAADGSAFGADAAFRFAGWAASPSGALAYHAGDPVKVKGNTTLYALWDTAYTDRFGGSDLIFLPKEKAGTAILVRGGKEFTGTVQEEIVTFVRNGETLTAKLYGSSFAWEDKEAAGVYTQQEKGVTLPASTLTVDAYRGAVWKNGAVETAGVLSPGEMGDWLFSRENGREIFHCKFTSSLFMVGGEEAGSYIDVYYTDDTYENVDTQGYTLQLDGYGTASLDTLTAVRTGSYTIEKQYTRAGYPLYVVALQWGDVTEKVYTMPLVGGQNAFLYADDTAGEYQGADGSSLTLDGFGIFDDSAAYTVNGVTQSAAYTAHTYLTMGTCVSFSGKTFLLEGNGFRLSEKEAPLYELSRLENNGGYRTIDPLLVLYGEEKEEGYLAELYEAGDTGYLLAAEGYYTETRLGENVYLSVFHQTKSYTDHAPMTFSYLVGGLRFENRDITAYYVLEWEGAVQYTVLEEQDGEGKFWQLSLPMGSLYFSPDGEVYQGTLSDFTAHTDFNNMRTFRFTYYDPASESFTSFGCEYLADGHYALREELPRNLFRTDAYGVTDIFASLAIDGKGNALYLADPASSGVKGSYKSAGMTFLGDEIFQLQAGTVSFSFILGVYYDLYTDSYYDVYYREDAERQGVFKSALGEMLELDGFYRGVLTEADGIEHAGTYFLLDSGDAYCFVDESDKVWYFSLEGKNMELYGAEYGEWELADDSYAELHCPVFFNGKGGVTFYWEEEPYEGTYTDAGEYMGMPQLLIRMEGEKKAFYVSFVEILLGERYCVLRNEDAEGLYVGDDWSVLELDGYGYGIFYDAEGHAGRRGISTFFDENSSHLRFQFSGNYSEALMAVLDHEKKTFSPQSYGEEKTYYADDLSGIRFGENGALYLGSSVGWYMAEGNTAVGYFVEEDNSYTAQTLFAPVAETGVYQGVTYTLWEGGALEKQGTISFLNEDGAPMSDYPDLSAVLTFTPDGVRYAVPAALSANGEEYPFTLEVSYTASGVKTSLVWEETSYPVLFGEEGFHATGGASVTVLRDAENTQLSHGTLTVSAFGFGPIYRQDPVIYGDLAYTDTAFTFTVAADSVVTVALDPDYGERHLLVFSSEGKEYALVYYLAGEEYYLYCLAEYEEFTSGNYTLGVMTYLYSSGNFTLLSAVAGEICGLVLYEEAPLLEYAIETTSNVLYGFHSANEQGEEDRGFVIRLTRSAEGEILSVSVTERVLV